MTMSTSGSLACFRGASEGVICLQAVTSLGDSLEIESGHRVSNDKAVDTHGLTGAGSADIAPVELRQGAGEYVPPAR